LLKYISEKWNFESANPEFKELITGPGNPGINRKKEISRCST